MNVKQVINSFAFVALLAGTSLAQAAVVPMDFTHHGVLWDGDKLAEGKTDIKAVLYDISGANPVEIASIRTYVIVENGYYAVTIPNIAPEKVRNAKGKLGFQLTIAEDPLEPIVPISSVPFAMVADRADSARVADAATDVLCDGCVNYDNMAEDIQKVLDSADSNGAIKTVAAGVIGDSQISFNYAGSNSKGGAASAIADDTVSTSKIQTGAVTTAKLADGNVTKAKLGSDVLYAASATQAGAASAIADGTVSTAKIVDKNVTLAKLSDGVQASLAKADKAITTGNNTVTSAMIVDGAIVTADLADNSVTSAKIVNGAIATADLANGSVTKDKLSGIYAAQAFGTFSFAVKSTSDCVTTSSGQGGAGGYCPKKNVSKVSGQGFSYTTNSDSSVTIKFNNSISNPIILGSGYSVTSTGFTIPAQTCTWTSTSGGTSACTGSSSIVKFVVFGD